MTSEKPASERFFVTVHASGERELWALQAYELDLFQATATVGAEGGASIEGLITLEAVARLVRAGYRVVVEDPMEARARARDEQGRLGEWLESRGRD